MFQCVHCDEQAVQPLFLEEDVEMKLPFCCRGCSTVYQVLKEHSLSTYYDIKKSSGFIKRRAPVEVLEHSFSYLDDPKFKAEHSYLTSRGSQGMDFYLEGIHCLACLWLIEKLPEFLPGVETSRLDLESSTVSVVLDDRTQFSTVAQELNLLGYRPHALKRNEDSKKYQAKDERSYLLRLGIAGAATGNIMIYSVSLYGGATENMARIFTILTVLLSLPVFTFSAWPFYHSAWISLKNKTLSIDIPIALSLILGFFMGIWGLFHDFQENYFDSLTALVFLLLLSRYFLRKIQAQGLSSSDLHYFYQNDCVLKHTETGFEEIHSTYVQKGDILKVRSGDFFPADGVVMKGDSLINSSLLTGESMPHLVRQGHQIFSGTQNLGAEILVKVEKDFEDSRLGRILKNVEQGWVLKSRTVDLTAEVAKYFTLVVILLSALLFIMTYLEHDLVTALTRALTLLIVTCPCALAISVPLTFHRSLSLAAQHGIIIKSDEVFEKLGSVEKIYLDKTGTITFGKLQVKRFEVPNDIVNIVYSLEEKSRHPVARALIDHCLKLGAKKIGIEDFYEIPGRGVQGNFLNHFYEIKEGSVFQDGVMVGSFEVRDVLRKDSEEIISRLKRRGLELFLLSGDTSTVVSRLALEVGIPETHALSRMSPEEKVSLVDSQLSVMIGDGANDAMALEKASVGIAVSGSMDIALRASDVYLTTPGLKGAEELFILSQETMKIIRRNLIFSISYNSLSVMLVFTGHISPLIAAIVMPMSSLTVLVSSIFGTKKLRGLWKF